MLGGARSGKSVLAERRAGSSGPVTYVATGGTSGDDPDLAARVAAHRARRPSTWTTVETGDLAAAVLASPGTVLVDSLTAWVAASPEFSVDVDGLCAVLVEHDGHVVVVSDEVGLGVHPSTEAGRRFRDALGLVNQAVAAVADEVLLVVAGRALPLDPG
jgi:adenosylcobinamide kinase/adenosylcobinamide-phosphate guanylyltransferase